MVSRARSTRLNGYNPLAYVGVNAETPANFVIENRPPTAHDNANFYVGDTWLDNSSYPTPPLAENYWFLASKANGVATWRNFGGGGALLTLTGNVGGPVPGDVNFNINTVGDNIGITVVGNPATNTLTWSLVGGGGGVATQSFHTDDNNVEVPIGTVVIPAVGAVGQINEFGGASAGNFYTNINTAQGANIHTVDINLNNSIGQPDTNITGTEGMYALGDNDNFVLDRFMYNYGTNNTFLGNLSGNLGLTVANATNNTCLGFGTGTALVGAAGGQGAFNVIVGSNAGGLLTNGSSNVMAGNLSGSLLLTGSNNVLLGQSSGTALVAAESSNIYLGALNVGVIGDNNTLRIGNASGAGAGNLNRAFLQGSYGVNPPGGGVQTVVQDMNGQLGTANVAPYVPPFGTTAFYAYTDTVANPFTLGTFLTMPLNNLVFDLGGNFNTGTFQYTCPNTGYYWFNAGVTLNAVPNTITQFGMSISPSVTAGLLAIPSFNPNLYQVITAATGLSASASWMQHLGAGETVEFQVILGGSAGNSTIEGGQSRTFFQGYQIF